MTSEQLHLGACALDIEAAPQELFPFEVWGEIAERKRTLASFRSFDATPQGSLALRAAISAMLASKLEVACEVSQIIIVDSLQEALALTLLALGPEIGTAILEDPGPLGLQGVVEATSLAVAFAAVDAAGVRLEEAARHAPGARLLVTRTTGQFPVGANLMTTRGRAIGLWARRSQGFIFENALESEFTFALPKKKSLFRRLGDRVIYFNSFHRSTFDSIGIAYLAVPKSLVSLFATATADRRQENALQQAILAEFLISGQFERHVGEIREIYRQRRSVLLESLASTMGREFSVEYSDAGLHVLLRLSKEIDDVSIAHEARRRGIVVHPLSKYYAGTPPASGLVLGFAAFADRRIVRAVDILAKILTGTDLRKDDMSYRARP